MFQIGEVNGQIHIRYLPTFRYRFLKLHSSSKLTTVSILFTSLMIYWLGNKFNPRYFQDINGREIIVLTSLVVFVVYLFKFILLSGKNSEVIIPISDLYINYLFWISVINKDFVDGLDPKERELVKVKLLGNPLVQFHRIHVIKLDPFYLQSVSFLQDLVSILKRHNCTLHLVANERIIDVINFPSLEEVVLDEFYWGIRIQLSQYDYLGVPVYQRIVFILIEVVGIVIISLQGLLFIFFITYLPRFFLLIIINLSPFYKDLRYDFERYQYLSDRFIET